MNNPQSIPHYLQWHLQLTISPIDNPFSEVSLALRRRCHYLCRYKHIINPKMNTLRNLIIAIVAFIPMLTAAQTEEPYRELTCDEMQERIDCLQREKSKNNIQLAGICNWWNDTILEYTVEFLENIDKKYRAGLYEEPSALMAEDGCKDILF